MAKITKFIRKRNVNPALTQNKTFARVQVAGNSLTFRFQKTAGTPTPPVVDSFYIRPVGGFYRRPGGIDRYIRPTTPAGNEFAAPNGDVYTSPTGDTYTSP
jgi:hypothetical protein